MNRMKRPESQAKTRADLVRTARDLFVADGLASTSLTQVAEAAGYSKGAVYSNFRNKNELCQEVLELTHREAMGAVAWIRGRAESPETRLQHFLAWTRARVEDVALNRLEFELVLAARNDARLRDQLAANVADLESAMAQLFAELTGTGTQERATEMAKTVFSLGVGLSALRLIDPTVSSKQLADVLPVLLPQENLKDDQDRNAEVAGALEKPSNRRPATARGDESRAALLAAAIDVFRTQRFDEVSTTEIAKRAGVAIGLINYHFGSKRGLYLAAAETVYGEFWDRLQALRGPAVSRLLRGLDLYIDTAESYDGSLLALSTRVPDAELRDLHQHHIDRLIGALMQELTGGSGTPLARNAIAGWFSFVEGSVTMWLRDRELSRVQLRELLVSSLFSFGQTLLQLAPDTPLSSRAITALLDHSQLPIETTEFEQ